MANNTWSNYTEKTATPVGADEVMVRDSTDGKNKRLLFGTFWKWIAKKLNEATISELETDNKTIIGAINALNGKSLINLGNVDVGIDTLKIYSNGTAIELIVKWENTLHAIVFDTNNRLYIQTSTDSGSTWKTIREI